MSSTSFVFCSLAAIAASNFHRASLDTHSFTNLQRQLPPSFPQGILVVRGNRHPHAHSAQKRFACYIPALSWATCRYYWPESSAAKEAACGSCSPSIDPLPHFYPRSEERRVGKECKSQWST